MITLSKIYLVFVFITLLAFACFANCEELALIGKLYLIGNTPFVKLVLETKENGKYYLESDMLSELKRLQHITVKVIGYQKKSLIEGQPPVFWVEKYQIVNIGVGENIKVPWVGILKIKGGKVILQSEQGKQYRIIGVVVEEFKEIIGAKVWVTGTLERGWLWKPSIINVDTYQVIRK